MHRTNIELAEGRYSKLGSVPAVAKPRRLGDKGAHPAIAASRRSGLQ